MIDMILMIYYLQLRLNRYYEYKTINISQPQKIERVLVKFYFNKIYLVNKLIKISINCIQCIEIPSEIEILRNNRVDNILYNRE